MPQVPKPDSLDPIMQDVHRMIQVIQRDQQHAPSEFYYTDKAIRLMGGNPQNYEELKPGVRIVRAS